MEGFFKDSETLDRQPLPLIPMCGACGLYKTCKSPKMETTGSGKKKILIVGEAPGAEEDERNRQFIGKSGRLLRDTLEMFGISPNRDCWFENALICRPPNNEIQDTAWIDYCRPNIMKRINELQPNVILLFGASAVKSVVQWAWDDDPLPLNRWIGRIIPSRKLNAWICPTYHPSYLLRINEQVTDRIWRENIKAAVALNSRPYDSEIPDLKSRLTHCLDDSAVDSLLHDLARRKKLISFDYETNMLKPDSAESRIVSCSVSDGEISLAFPWMKRAAKAMKKILEDRTIKKIGYNLKFEERWTLAKLGISVKNWIWDGMLAAHTLDNRPDTKSLNFQMFIHLGIPVYDQGIKPFLRSKGYGANSQNRIGEIKLSSLLEYNAMDSLVEFMVAQKQWKLFK